MAMRMMTGLLLVVAGCGTPECEPGTRITCYPGEARTSGRGQCRSGTALCTAAGVAGDCEGARGPTAEVCDRLDNDCDGLTDEGVVNPCGGCAPLTGSPGQACAPAGRLECVGRDELRCSG